MISINYKNMMEEVIGEEHGISDKDIDRFVKDGIEISRDLKSRRGNKELEFFNLPYRSTERIKEVGNYLRENFDNFVHLGIGGSALGGIALHRALNHPYYNLLPEDKRKTPRMFFVDNIDPDKFHSLLNLIDIKRSSFSVVSKSGATIETITQFLVVKDILKEKLGNRYKDHIIVITDPNKGWLRRIVEEENFISLQIPEGVGGRFSVFTPVGLLPAYVSGINIDELLKGAVHMDKLCSSDIIWENPAYLSAALQFISYIKKNKRISIFIPYSDSLSGIADWFCQLWAESLGKKYSLNGNIVNIGPTPIKAIGVTDQHSQLQLYLEGPYDKVITFIKVNNFNNEVKILSEDNEFNFLRNRTMNELIEAERYGTELSLIKAKRCNYTITLDRINPFTIGEFLYMLQVQTAFAGGLFKINPFDQPGVEEGKRFTSAIMGKRGYEKLELEIKDLDRGTDKYIWKED
jgi:glucose-6-phosphate isomerase